MMDEIRVYRSLGQNLLLLLGCAVFVAIGYFMIRDDEYRVIAWIGILFFGLGGLFHIYTLLRERIGDKPLYIITDKCVYMDSGGQKGEVWFAEVEEFYLYKMGRSNLIGIRYKPNVVRDKLEDASTVGRAVRKLNTHMSGSQEALLADNLSLKPQALCDLLNERLKKS